MNDQVTLVRFISSPTLVFNTNISGKNYDILEEAANEWNEALGKDAVEIKHGPISKNPKTADNINSITTGNLSANKLGVTYNHVGTIKSSNNVTKTKKESDIVIEPNNDPNLFKAVALHEIGHALGAEHVNDKDAVMNATLEIGDRSNIPTKLTQADIDSINSTGNYINISA